MASSPSGHIELQLKKEQQLLAVTQQEHAQTSQALNKLRKVNIELRDTVNHKNIKIAEL